ncbi:MAG: SgcJ/EcaC family oxidoreductase [Pseudomonadales bacterium]
MKRTALLAAACLALLPAASSFADDVLTRTIMQRENDWASAYNAHDFDRLGAIYEEDAVLIPPGMAPVRGREAIQTLLQSLSGQIQQLELIVDEVRPLGTDYAVEIGRSVYRAVAADGSSEPATDNYVVVWHRGLEGEWRYVTDIFNQGAANAAEPVAPPTLRVD